MKTLLKNCDLTPFSNYKTESSLRVKNNLVNTINELAVINTIAEEHPDIEYVWTPILKQDEVKQLTDIINSEKFNRYNNIYIDTLRSDVNTVLQQYKYGDFYYIENGTTIYVDVKTKTISIGKDSDPIKYFDNSRVSIYMFVDNNIIYCINKSDIVKVVNDNPKVVLNSIYNNETKYINLNSFKNHIRNIYTLIKL